jgi:hypothetical protein
MLDYSYHYALTEVLELEPSLIPSPPVCNTDIEILYAAIMDRLAQPLPDGSESPFSARSPLSTESHLTSGLVYLLSMHGHECNLIPNSVWLSNLRLQGVRLQAAEYPLVMLQFNRVFSSLALSRLVIPAGTKVFSRARGDYHLITTQDAEMPGTSVQVLARLNVAGKNTFLTPQEFDSDVSNLAGVENVKAIAVISYGKDIEGMEEAVLRARQELQEQARVVTARDFYQQCLRLGCQKINVLPGVAPGVEGVFNDLTLVVIYPSALVTLVDTSLNSLSGSRCQVISADILEVTGGITVRAVPDLSEAQAIALCNQALADKINPPFGKWGDRNLEASIATALEQTAGIFAMKSAVLSVDDTPLIEVEVKPWQLFNLTVEWRVDR